MPQKGASCDVPHAQYDPTDPGGTYRPNLPPATEKGTDFNPLKMDKRDPVVKDPPSDPLGIFQAFLPASLVQEWVDATNEAVAALCQSPETTSARLRDWKPTSVSEVYVFIGVVICMQNHTEDAMTDYWTTFQSDGLDPFYPWTRHMPLHRFQQLWRHVRFCDETTLTTEEAAEKAYMRVDRWSQHIQDTLDKIYEPGSDVAVDECIQGFTGKSSLKTYIPNKPTPEGIKIWIYPIDRLFHI